MGEKQMAHLVAFGCAIISGFLAQYYARGAGVGEFPSGLVAFVSGALVLAAYHLGEFAGAIP